MKRLFSSTLAITFPEGVTLAFPLAGGVSRFLAWFVYVLAVAALGTAVAKTLRGLPAAARSLHSCA
jgi:hypothetical protein